MTDVRSHLAETYARLSTSPIVKTVAVVEERLGYGCGYIRARLTLINDNFLEAAEYFTIEDDNVCVKRYRYQWMDSAQQVLRKRWDNTRHFPELSSFPHHVHVGSEEFVVPGEVLTIVDLISLVEDEQSNRSIYLGAPSAC